MTNVEEEITELLRELSFDELLAVAKRARFGSLFSRLATREMTRRYKDALHKNVLKDTQK